MIRKVPGSILPHVGPGTLRSSACLVLAISLVLLSGAMVGSAHMRASDPPPGVRDGYGLAVTGADQEFLPGDGSAAPPVGWKWIVVSASLSNLAGDAVVVEAAALTLVGGNGDRYTPDPANGYAQPTLLGAALSTGEWILGRVLFQVPSEFVGEWLEWCPSGGIDCTAPLRSPVPMTPTGRELANE